MKKQTNIIGIFKIINLISLVFLPISTSANMRNICIEKNNLSKVIIYDGRRMPITDNSLFDLGFTHVSVTSASEPISIPNKRKYVLWTGVASNDANARWARDKTPYIGEDINDYEKRWNNRLNYYKKKYYNKNDKDKFGVIILDIEAKKTNNQLKKNPPFNKESGYDIDTIASINEYKKQMSSLYYKPLVFAKQKHNYYQYWSSYSDVPIERNWWGIPSQNWSEWTGNPINLNYVTHNLSGKSFTENPFAKDLDFYSVSTYYFYHPDVRGVNVASQYLSYMLFQLEVNQTWANGKPIYLYQSFIFYGDKERGRLISKDMVRNSLIFALISGAEGIILFDGTKKLTNDSKYIDLFNTFTSTIKELEKYSEFFNGDVIYYRPNNPRDLFVGLKPVIRGIEKNGKLLIAATNPFASSNQVTKIPIYYKGKYFVVELEGSETLIKEIILDV